MPAHDTRVRANNTESRGSNHWNLPSLEPRLRLRYSSGDISGCWPASKKITKLTTAMTPATLYCAMAIFRTVAGVRSDETVVIITQLPAAHAISASRENPIEMLGQCNTESIISVNGCQL